ncbi:MAG: LytTR family DNA-binding domain-containing protein [Oscillospiraceae bacterium]|nr:LytTR family DNA-binding domain-containing protein [Oscillospiraceae bacterium]
MLRVAVCDDMNEFLTSTRARLEHWDDPPTELTVELFQDGDGLIERHKENPFDILLLDVLMPLQNGIETAAEIRRFDPSVKIVFLTATSDFAEESYAVHANNYLIKPVSTEKLYRCIDTLYQELQEQSKWIMVSTAAAIHRIEIRKIEYLEAQGKKVLVGLSDGRSLLSNHPFYSFEKQLLLEDGFFKCHRSYLVNIYRIITYTQKEIQMQSGIRIPISRSCHSEFEAAYFDLLFREGAQL